MAKQQSKRVIPFGNVTAAKKAKLGSAAKIFAKIKKLQDEIIKLEDDYSNQEEQAKELKRSLAGSSVRRMSRIEKFSIKEEKYKREHEIRKLRDKLAEFFPKAKGNAKLDMVKTQYSSQYTVHRYGRYIEAATVKLLNKCLTLDKTKMTELKKLAAKANTDNIKLFNEELLELFMKHDAVSFTKLTANAQYKKISLERIRITIAGWDFDKGPIEILAEVKK